MASSNFDLVSFLNPRRTAEDKRETEIHEKKTDRKLVANGRILLFSLLSRSCALSPALACLACATIRASEGVALPPQIPVQTRKKLRSLSLSLALCLSSALSSALSLVRLRFQDWRSLLTPRGRNGGSQTDGQRERQMNRQTDRQTKAIGVLLVSLAGPFYSSAREERDHSPPLSFFFPLSLFRSGRQAEFFSSIFTHRSQLNKTPVSCSSPYPRKESRKARSAYCFSFLSIRESRCLAYPSCLCRVSPLALSLARTDEGDRLFPRRNGGIPRKPARPGQSAACACTQGQERIDEHTRMDGRQQRTARCLHFFNVPPSLKWKRFSFLYVKKGNVHTSSEAKETENTSEETRCASPLLSFLLPQWRTQRAALACSSLSFFLSRLSTSLRRRCQILHQVCMPSASVPEWFLLFPRSVQLKIHAERISVAAAGGAGYGSNFREEQSSTSRLLEKRLYLFVQKHR